MTKPLSRAWAELVSAYGGVHKFATKIGASHSTFYRAARGVGHFTPQQRTLITELANKADLPNPLTEPSQTSPDLTALRLMGEAIEQGFPPSTRELARLRKQYPPALLIQLAESEAPPAILQAVTLLLSQD